jgi:seryl-tRNA synthetase
MQFDLAGRFVLSADAKAAEAAIRAFFEEANATILKRKGAEPGTDEARVHDVRVEGSTIHVKVESKGRLRAHDALLRLRKAMGEKLGKAHRLGVRDVIIDAYEVTFELEKPVKHPVMVPFAKAVRVEDRTATLELANVDAEFLENNYIDRMINLVREKVNSSTTRARESTTARCGRRPRRSRAGTATRPRPWWSATG